MATTELDDDAKRDVRAEFGEAVNMTAAQLRTWLDSDESRSVGDSGGSGKESTGHEMADPSPSCAARRWPTSTTLRIRA